MADDLPGAASSARIRSVSMGGDKALTREHGLDAARGTVESSPATARLCSPLPHRFASTALSLAAGLPLAAQDAAPSTIVPAQLLHAPDGLEVTVWATTPLLHNPTNIDFDKDGRLWVAEGVNYRSHGSGGPEGDRIVVLEDYGRRRQGGQERDVRAGAGSHSRRSAWRCSTTRSSSRSRRTCSFSPM